MLNMLIWLAVVLVLFAIGDLIAKLTHARISSVFATLMLFLILFVTGIIPSDIIDRAGLTSASSWSLPMLLFAMGSMINLRQFIDEWRTVVTCWLGIIAVIICVSLTIPLIGKEMALASIPVINGALPATTIMVNAANEAGFPLAAALATIAFAVQSPPPPAAARPSPPPSPSPSASSSPRSSTAITPTMSASCWPWPADC